MTSSKNTNLQSQVKHAINLRLNLFATRNALRLSHHELIDNLTIDYYNSHILFTDYADRDRHMLEQLADILLDELNNANLPITGVELKHRSDNLSHMSYDPSACDLLAGSPSPDTFEITEHTRHYLVSFHNAGFGTGLFLDMVNGRDIVQQLAQNYPRVLNLFSYTGAFSIAVAHGGALRVIEVDTSSKWLKWSRQNQQLNNVIVVRQRRDDAVKFLTRQKDATFDMIICDPPSYAKPRRGKHFTIEVGYKTMIPHFSRVLSTGGVLLACCNHADTSRNEFKSWFTRYLNFNRWITPPLDFPNATYLKIALFRNP